MASLDGLANHLFHAVVALFVVERHDLAVTVNAEAELREVVRADRVAVEEGSELVHEDDVVRDLAHRVDLQAVLPAGESELGHLGQHRLRLLHPADEGDHEDDVREAHVLADPLHGLALEGEAFDVGRVCVAGRPAPADHRVALDGLEGGAAEETRVLVGLEVAHAHDNGLGPERRGDGADPLGEPLDEERLAVGVAAGEPGDRGGRLGIRDLLRVEKRHRVGPDRLADDELHPGEPDTVVRQERRLEGEVRVAEVDHDVGLGALQALDLGAHDVERDLAVVDAPGVALGARRGDEGALRDGRGAVSRADDGRDAELAGDDRRVAGPPTSVRDDRGGGLHDGLPVRGRHVRDQHLAGVEVRQVGNVDDDACVARGDLLADAAAGGEDLAGSVEDVGLEARRLALRGDRLGTGLDEVEESVEPVLGPFHVHRPVVVLLDRDRVLGKLEDVLVGQAEPLAVGLGSRDVPGRHPLLALDEDHLDCLVADEAAQHGTVALLEGGLEDVVLVGVDGALDDVLAEAVGAGDEDDVPEAGLGVEREHDARRGEVRAHHLHDADRQCHVEVVESLVNAVVDGTVGEEAREAAPAGVEEALVPVDVEVGVLLAGEARRRQVLGRRRRPHRQAHLVPVLLLELAVGGDDLVGEVLGQPGAVDDLPGALAAAREVGDVLGVELVDRLVERRKRPGFLQHVAVALGRDGEAVGDADALVGQFLVHLAEGGILATDDGHVLNPDLLEKADVFEAGHVWSSCS